MERFIRKVMREKSRVLSLPDAIRPVTKLRIGTASAIDIHSLSRRTNPPAASIIVPWYRLA